MHLDDLTNADSHIFNDTMQAFGLKSNVISLTHKYSHILDLGIQWSELELNLNNCKVHEFISDHTPSDYWHHTQQDHHGNPLKG